MSEQSAVLFYEENTHSGHVLGHARLNNPKALNAQTRAMVQELTAQLNQWAERDDVVAVILDGSEDRAFCAGADIVNLYREMQKTGSGPCAEAEGFFIEEYALVHQLHTYNKPIICWGSGVVMGGGLGLLQGASHRIVTDTSRLAMPEITIGLFPDVAAGWFFNRMPGRTGLFLAVTGSHFNAHDAWLCGLADYYVDSTERAAVYERLRTLHWQGSYRHDSRQITQALLDFERAAPEKPAANVLAHQATIAEITAASTAQDFYDNLMTLQNTPWLEKAAATIAAGSPMSIALSFEQWQRGRNLSLAQTFKREVILAINCVRSPDLSEGIRALLVDKDKQPQWSPAHLAEIDALQVQQYFELPKDYAVNPLQGLQ